MAKKHAAKSKRDSDDALDDIPVDAGDQPAAETTPFVAVRSANGGSWQYYDQAGRLYRGYQTEEQAQAAADTHQPLLNDPTLDEDQ